MALGDQRIIESTTCRQQSPARDAHAQILRRLPDFAGTDLEDIERATIERVFSKVKGDKALAGKMLGISRATLYRKLKRYNIGAREDAPQCHTAIVT